MFMIDSGVRNGCIISPWLFNVYMDVVMKKVKMGIGRRKRVEITWPLKYRLLGGVWRVGGEPEGDGGKPC